MFTELEKQKIQLPAGFTMRPTTLEDAPAVAEMLNDSAELLTGLRPETAKELSEDWQMPGFNLAHSTRVVCTPEGQVVGYMSVWDIAPLPATIWTFARVHPAFEGLGIATALHQWGEERAREAITRVPGGAKVAMRAGALTQHEAGKAFLLSHGFNRVRYFFRMAIDLENKELPAAHWPNNVKVYGWDEVQDKVTLRDIVEADNEAFRDHWGFVEQPLDEMVTRWEHMLAHSSSHDPSAFFIAMDGDQIAGLSLCFMESQGQNNWGYVDTLCVRRPWRKHGVGLALLLHTYQDFQKRGYVRMELHVDASSLTGATRLYERSGMYVAEQSESFEKILREGPDLATQSLVE